MSNLLDQSGSDLLDQSGAALFDQSGGSVPVDPGQVHDMRMRLPNGQWANIINHNLYGPRHVDVDSAAALAENEGLFWDADAELFKPETRVNWVADHVNGDTRYKGDQVLDSGWLMIANKETTDPAGPITHGPTFYVYTGVMLEQATAASQVVFGNRYTLSSTGYIQGYRVYVVSGNHYTVYSVKDPLGIPVQEALADFTATTTGWRDFAVTPVFLTGSTQFDLVAVVNEPDPTPTINTYSFDYKTPQNASGPASGEIQHSRGQSDVMSISYTDDGGGDRTAFLQGLSVGDIIEGAGQRWSIQSSGDQGTYISFGVNPALTGAPTGVQDFNFETVTPTPITYAYDVDWWLTSGYNAQGLLGIDTAYTDITPSDNVYGTDLLVQYASVSDDWDYLASSEMGAGASSFASSEWGVVASSSTVSETIAADYTLPAGTRYADITCINTTPITITLPTVDRRIQVEIMRAGVGAVTIAGAGTDQVQGASTQRIPSRGDGVDLIGTTLGWLLR